MHIADVSHYVREGTALDADAYARGTSVYFPDRSIPMLPPRLSSGICSLNPGVDRLVLSALMEVDPRGRVVEKRFAKGVLRSRERMTYTSVAKILVDRDPAERNRYADLVSLFEMMEELCLILSKKRYRRGSVDFDLPEAEIEFDKDGKVIRIVPAEHNIAHRIIEEFMLLANECVAERLTASGGPALYRVHEEPDPAKVDEFAEFALTLGYKLEKHDGKYRPKDFQKFVRQLQGKLEQTISCVPHAALIHAGALLGTKRRTLWPGRRRIYAFHFPNPTISRSDDSPFPEGCAWGRATPRLAGKNG